MKKAIFPGSFDPITNGHFDIIKRGVSLFDEVIVAIGVNAEKKYMFSLEDRKRFIEEAFKDEPKVKVITYSGLTIDLCKKEKADFIAAASEYVKVLPKCDLNTLKALISKCDLVIGNDTGPTHMAWALNIPSITIFGPTPTNRIYETSINKFVKSSSKVNPLKLNKNDFSINEIKEEEIITIAKSLL